MLDLPVITAIIVSEEDCSTAQQLHLNLFHLDYVTNKLKDNSVTQEDSRTAF